MMEEDRRPDPDALLQALREDAKEKYNGGRGRLKIFFGMAAGVGKTYAMLEAAGYLAGEGVDVVVGYVETHGRAETEELVRGLKVLPRKAVEHRGITITELDLDALLARRPGIALVDELAHTNAEGMRHAKRYQDVLELLGNGIHVYTTLNVQHVESQADIVEKITGVKIRETIPDSVLDRADEIELVDIPPEELLKRLSEGKVYVPDKAGLAAEKFFRKSNLTALREMSLRFVAGLVGYELHEYIQKRHIRGPWKSGERLLVAVSPSPYSEYLIRWTRRMAFNLKAQWIAVYIEQRKELSDSAQTLLRKNLDLARELGAEVVSTADEDIIRGLLSTAEQKNITQIVVGKPLRRYMSDLFRGGNLVERLLKASGDIEIHAVTRPDAGGREKPAFSVLPFSFPLREYFDTVGIISALTAVNLLLTPFTGYWTIALIYLLAVVILSLFTGRGAVITAAGLSALLWNFLFIPPTFTFRISKVEDALMFGMYFVIAMILGSLTSRLRRNQQALQSREKRLSALYELSKALGTAVGVDNVVQTVVKFAGDYFQAEVAVILPDDSENLRGSAHPGSTLVMTPKESAVAAWVYKNKKSAGRFTDTLPNSAAHYVPLVGPGGMVGVMGIRPLSGKAFSFEMENLLQSITYQLSLVLEREQLLLLNRDAVVAAESERLYKILINSITHELRTPLTAIKGLLSTLMDPAVGDDGDTRKSLLEETQDSNERLIRLVDNLLDMGRIESGRLTLNLDWNDMSDIIGMALRRLEDRLKTHPVNVVCPDDIPLVRVDYNLMEQALYCIIHNALVHTEDGTPVAVAVTREDGGITITVDDEGSGLPDGDMERLFDKFFRTAKVSSHGGLGLGLSISRGIVELHGGTISAENRKPGGARFTVKLPAEMKDKAG